MVIWITAGSMNEGEEAELAEEIVDHEEVMQGMIIWTNFCN